MSSGRKILILFGFLGLAAAVGFAWWNWPSLVAGFPWNEGNSINASVGYEHRREALGQMGDLFGSFNALFGALACLGVGCTIFLQMAALVYTQKQMKDAADTAELQRFEGTFFQLIETFNSIVGGFEKHDVRKGWFKRVTLTGREVINHDIEGLLKDLADRQAGASAHDDPSDLIRLSYGQFYHQHEMRLAHYFRMLYRILKWLDRAPKDKKFYAKTLRAQLSSQEVVLLMYNCLFDYGKDMKPLVEKYTLLKHLSDGHGDFEYERNRFAPGAFEDPEE